MIEQKIKEIIVKQLNINPDKITLKTNIMNDLSADSIDMIEMMLSLEQTFSIKINDEATENVKTVADIIALVETLIKK